MPIRQRNWPLSASRTGRPKQKSFLFLSLFLFVLLLFSICSATLTIQLSISFLFSLPKLENGESYKLASSQVFFFNQSSVSALVVELIGNMPVGVSLVVSTKWARIRKNTSWKIGANSRHHDDETSSSLFARTHRPVQKWETIANRDWAGLKFLLLLFLFFWLAVFVCRKNINDGLLIL